MSSFKTTTSPSNPPNQVYRGINVSENTPSPPPGMDDSRITNPSGRVFMSRCNSPGKTWKTIITPDINPHIVKGDFSRFLIRFISRLIGLFRSYWERNVCLNIKIDTYLNSN